MQAVGAIGKMGHTQVFTSGKQVFQSFRDQGPKRDLEGPCRHIGVGFAVPIWMNVQGVVPYSDGIRHERGPRLLTTADLSLKAFDDDLRLQDRPERSDASRLAYIGANGAAIRRIEDIRPQPKFRVTCPLFPVPFSGTFRLQPIDVAERSAAGTGQRGLDIRRASRKRADDISAVIVVAARIDHRQIGRNTRVMEVFPPPALSGTATRA